MEAFIAGSLSGLSQIIVGHPLDTYKIWQQNNTYFKIKINNLYSGIKYPLYTSTLCNSALFGFNYLFTVKYNISNQFMTGGLTGLVTSILTSPIELYKIKAQCQHDYNPLLYRGLSLTILREVPACSIYFGTYNYLYHKKNYNTLVSGGISGILCWGLIHPIDTVKTRYQSGLYTFRQSWTPKNIWKGVGMSCLRAGIVNSVGFTVYQESLPLIKKYS